MEYTSPDVVIGNAQPSISDIEGKIIAFKNKEDIISNLLSAVKNIAEMLIPFLPESAEKILEQIKIKKSKSLFPRL